MTRKCVVCNGTGQIWAAVDGHSQVICWRCLGKGNVPDEHVDIGEEIG